MSRKFEDSFELESVSEHQTPALSLFPEITYNSTAPLTSNSRSLWPDEAVVSIIDDAASSINLDEIDAPLEEVAKSVYNNPGEISDFHEYNLRTADQILEHERRQKRRQRRQEKQFGNYFTQTLATNRLSYNIDHFDGQRQNEVYNAQLNLMMDHQDGASYLTEIIDDMSSSSDGEFENEISGRDLKRTIMLRHVNSAGFAGSIGVSSMLVMGQCLSAAGPLGALIGFIVAGILVLASLLSYGELISFLPLGTGLPGVASRFLDNSLGFTVGFMYWFSNAIALPLELTSAAMMLTGYPELAEPGVVTVWIIVILVIVLFINLLTARIYSDFQYIIDATRFIIIIGLTFFMIFLNRGLVGPLHDNVGFRYWAYNQSDFDLGLIYGPFRQVFPIHLIFKTTSDEQIDVWGIPGSVGRFLQVFQSIIIASRSFMGTDIVFASVGETRNPRRAMAQGTKRIFWRIIVFYILSIFIFGLTIYAGDSNLIVFGSIESFDTARENKYELWKVTSSVQIQHELCSTTNNHLSGSIIMGFNKIPWIVALQTVGLCSTAYVFNALFVIFAIASSSSHLYASTRTLYGIFRTIFNSYNHWYQRPGICNSIGVPIYAMLLSFPFALLAFTTTHTSSFRIFLLLLNIASTASIIVWSTMALAFIRFFYAFKSRNLSRDDVAYPFKTPFQPYLAYIGFVGFAFLSILQGYTVFLKTNWNADNFISFYISPILFIVIYSLHKLLIGSRWVKSSEIDLDTGRREIERAEWEEDRKFEQNFLEWMRQRWYYFTGTHTRRRKSRSS